MGIEFRNPTPPDYEAAIDTMSTAFLERPDTRLVAEFLREVWVPDRTWLAWDDDRVVGTFRSWGTRLTVPGGAELPAAAVAGVTVLPTHRRRGVMSGMAAREHARIRERGEVVALLYAAEYPIYGRLGYGPAVRLHEYTFDARRSGFRRRAAGTCELVRADAAARDTCRGVFETWRRRQAGEIWRRDVTWDLAFALRPEPWGEPWKGFVVLHRSEAGSVDGYARYRAEPAWDHGRPAGRLTVDELHALSPEAEADLVALLLETDLVATVTFPSRRTDEAFLWRLTDQRAARVSSAGDGLWVRLSHIPRALEARTYEREGRVVLDVVDGPGGEAVRVLLEGGPDGATCRPTGQAPDLTLPASALGAAYLGGTRLAHAVLATGVDEHRSGALADADAMLRTAEAPWCSTFF